MRRPGASRALVAAVLASVALSGCSEIQSALAPQGPEAARVATLWWVLLAGAVVIFAAVIAFTALAMFGGTRWRTALAGERAIVAGGVVFPLVTLTVLLVYGVLVMRGNAAADAPAPIRLTVVGEQWWWRVIYRGPDGETFESANEVRIPAGRRADIALVSADVIHSFWVPNLAGKVDMIPGRTNRITIQADRPGISRGQCAEYCGGAHALMAFNVVALQPDEYERWLAVEAGPASAPRGAAEERGRLLFLSNGCGSCHTIRGTEARGVLGPDLTHLGSRTSLAAGILPNDAEALARWIVGNQHIKPENRMPPYAIFSDAELADLASYLTGLK
jgi:cytochrome c oxidase subunit 2